MRSVTRIATWTRGGTGDAGGSRQGRRVSLELVGELLGLGVPPEFVPPSQDCAVRLANSMRRQTPTPQPLQDHAPDRPRRGPAPPPAPGPASLQHEPLPDAGKAAPGGGLGRQRRRQA